MIETDYKRLLSFQDEEKFKVVCQDFNLSLFLTNVPIDVLGQKSESLQKLQIACEPKPYGRWQVVLSLDLFKCVMSQHSKLLYKQIM